MGPPPPPSHWSSSVTGYREALRQPSVASLARGGVGRPLYRGRSAGQDKCSRKSENEVQTMKRRSLTGVALVVAVIGGGLLISSEAEAKVMVINTGKRVWEVGPIPAALQRDRIVAQRAREGARLGYECSAFGVFWAYFHWWDCKPVIGGASAYWVLPPSLAAQAAQSHPKSQMKMGFWGQYGRFVLLLLLLGSIFWGII